MKSEVRVRGFFRAQIIDKKTKKIVGDSGRLKNTITNLGLNDMCAGAAIGASGSKQAKSMVLATQSTTVNATQVSLVGTIESLQTLAPSTIATGTGRSTCSFDGADHAGTKTIGSIGLMGTNVGNGSLLAGQTFNTSQFTSEQDVNATHDLEFS